LFAPGLREISGIGGRGREEFHIASLTRHEGG
jgi:hypothetical protein